MVGPKKFRVVFKLTLIMINNILSGNHLPIYVLKGQMNFPLTFLLKFDHKKLCFYFSRFNAKLKKEIYSFRFNRLFDFHFKHDLILFKSDNDTSRNKSKNINLMNYYSFRKHSKVFE